MIRRPRYLGRSLRAPWWFHWHALAGLALFAACVALVWLLLVITGGVQ